VEASRDIAPESDSKPGISLHLGWRSILIALAVLATALAATFFVLWLQAAETSPDEVAEFLSGEEPEVQRVSAELISLLSNYDATNIDQVAKRMLEISTGNFRADFEEVFASGLGGALEEVSASTRGEVLSGPDISFRSPSEAVAIARVSQTVQNRDLPEGRTFEYLIEITLIDTVGGGWKADRVEILSGRET
jgi:hypothetical protein